MDTMADIRQSAAYAKFIRSIGWRVEKIGGVNVFIRNLGIAKIQRANVPTDFPKIPGVWMTKLEPMKFGPVPKGFRQDGWPLLASKTQRIDLKKIKPKKDCRYCIRRSQRLASSVQKNNFGIFYKLWRKAAGIKRLWIPPEKDYLSLINAFGKNAICITIDNLAGAVVLIHQKTAYYYYAASLPAGKLLHLPYLVVWELMKETKKRECKIWDWEGIYDERWPNKGWKGFTHFKKSFGGYEVSFPGSFTRWF
ncbi:TPA: hypothetical protein DCZ81_03855 [Candidatus Collierbacteria bacterium]|uniref:Methicillin resistance protein n=1 Tax=Candidatus Amesbacteria bacterium GW2011_GWC2_47_8 TaxID=1618367 RepID=A0A0G1WRQ2_9BACT|nr:MAG: Methicillin resistance protein [Candidatus Amesbacteria bacterium GW2011_GWC2_47_8]HBC45275.1 hypothetical protein [Candidatus Collierbacteria bacterium]